MGRLGRMVIAALLVVASAALEAPVSAWAAFPGGNGRIAFVRADLSTGSCPKGEIFTSTADGQEERSLTSGIDLGVIGGVAWSADGKRIAFTVQTDIHEPLDVMGVLVMDADGANKAGLVNIPVRDDWRCDPQAPTWSPDGSKLAVAGADGIYTVDVGGDHQTRFDHRRCPRSLRPARVVARRDAHRGPRGGARSDRGHPGVGGKGDHPHGRHGRQQPELVPRRTADRLPRRTSGRSA